MTTHVRSYIRMWGYVLFQVYPTEKD